MSWFVLIDVFSLFVFLKHLYFDVWSRHNDYLDFNLAEPATLPRLKLIIEVLYPAARTSSSATAFSHKARADAKGTSSFAVNDLVMILDTNRANKMEPPCVCP